MSDCKSDIEAKLKDAKNQYHLFRTGQLPRVIVQEDGQRVEFNNASQIKDYIAELESQLNATPKHLPPATVLM